MQRPNRSTQETRDDDYWAEHPPRTDVTLASFHYEVSDATRAKIIRFFDAVEDMFGEATAEAMAVAFIEKTFGIVSPETLRDVGWRQYLEDPNWTDWVDLTGNIRHCAAYGIDGAIYGEYMNTPREHRVRELHDVATRWLKGAKQFLPDDATWALEFALARFAFDFDKAFTLRDLQLLGRISYAAVRNAVSAGELHPSADGTVDHDQGARWLSKRRDFVPSRWRDQNDDQEPIGFSEGEEFTQVPQSEDGPFLPETAVRRNRATGGIHVTIGPKGDEESVANFFEALRKLAQMPTPRWRRRNKEGNWGIVRARGAWVAVPTDTIMKQLASFLVND